MRAVWLGPWMLWRLCLVGVLSVLGLSCGVWGVVVVGVLVFGGLVWAGVFFFFDFGTYLSLILNFA